MIRTFRTAPCLGSVAVSALLLAAASPVAAELRAVKTSDSILDASALLMPASGKYGRAINGQAFQATPLLSHGGYQYATWYRAEGTDEESVMIARRTISGAQTGAWEVVETSFDMKHGDRQNMNEPAWDAHNVISLGISKNDGRLHLSFDHHLNNLRYAVSKPGTTSGSVAWDASMFGSEQSALSGVGVFGITYPMFFATHSGDLQFSYRKGASVDGTYYLSTWADPDGDGTYAWSTPAKVIGPTGSYVIGSSTSQARNGYPNGFTYDANGRLHTTFVWRESIGANHDLNYAYSDDGGITWKNNLGNPIANTAADDMILIGDDDLVVVPLDTRQSLYNQQSQAVDSAGGVHTVVVHRRQEVGYEYRASHPQWDPERSAYHHYYRDPVSGEWSMNRLPVSTGVGARPAVGVDAEGNVYAVYTDRGPEDGDYKYNAGNLIIAGATAAGDYSDWTILHTELLDVQFIGEPLIDTQRLLSDGILSIFIQENSLDTGRTGTNLHVIEFAVPEPGAAGLLAAGALGILGRRRSRR